MTTTRNIRTLVSLLATLALCSCAVFERDIGRQGGDDDGASSDGGGGGGGGGAIDGGGPPLGPDAGWNTYATYLGFGPKGVYDMAVDATDLYWTVDGVESGDAGVWKVSRAGGTAEQLVSLPARLYGIALDDTYVYFANYAGGLPGTGAIMRVSKTGGPPQTVVGNLTAPHQLVIDGANVYWTSSPWYTGGVFVAPKAGGIETRLGGPLDGALDLVVQGGYVYFTEGHAGRIARIPVGGGPAETIAEGYAATRWLAVDDTRVYFDTCVLVDCHDQALRSTTLTGGDPVSHLEITAADGQISLGGDSAFFARTETSGWPDKSGGLFVIDKRGLNAPRFIGGHYDPSLFTIVADPDGQHVYWADYENGSVGVMDPFL